MLPQPVLYQEVQQSELLLRGLPWKATPPEVALFLLGCGFQVNEGDIQLCLYQGRPNGRAVIRAKTTEDAIRAQSAVHGRAWGQRYIEAHMRSSCARTWCSAQFCDTQFPPYFGQTTQNQAKSPNKGQAYAAERWSSAPAHTLRRGGGGSGTPTATRRH